MEIYDNLLPTPTSGRADQGLSPSQIKRNSFNLAQTIELISLQEVSHVSHSPVQEKGKEQKMTVISGLNGGWLLYCRRGGKV